MFFFFVPLGYSRVLNRRPLVTDVLLALNMAVFFIPLMVGFDHRAVIGTLGYRGETTFSEPWRLITHQFVHSGFFHFAFNMLYLYLTGGPVEDRIGPGRMLALYLVGGVCAAWLHLMLASRIAWVLPLVGASGSISALMGAFCVLMPWSEFRVFYVWFLLFRARAGFYDCPALLLLGAYYFLSNLFSGMISLGQAHGGVAYWAHVGGFAFGATSASVLYGFRALFRTEAELEAEERKARRTREKKQEVGGHGQWVLGSKTEPAVQGAPLSEIVALLHYIRIKDAPSAKAEYYRLLGTYAALTLRPDIHLKLDELLLDAPPAGRVEPTRPGGSTAGGARYGLRAEGSEWTSSGDQEKDPSEHR